MNVFDYSNNVEEHVEESLLNSLELIIIPPNVNDGNHERLIIRPFYDNILGIPKELRVNNEYYIFK
jgi:hypothetical protein